MAPRLQFLQSCSFEFISFFFPVLQWLSLHFEILIMFLSWFPFTFSHIHNEMFHFIALLMNILVLIGTVFVIIWKMFHGRISLNSEFLLLLVNFVSGFWLKLKSTTSLIKSTPSSPWFSAACAAKYLFASKKRLTMKQNI